MKGDDHVNTHHQKFKKHYRATSPANDLKIALKSAFGEPSAIYLL